MRNLQEYVDTCDAAQIKILTAIYQPPTFVRLSSEIIYEDICIQIERGSTFDVFKRQGYWAL